MSGFTDIGEEYDAKNSREGTLTVGVYNQATDALDDTKDLADLTTEPVGSAYARQSDNFTALKKGGNWGTDNDNKLTFDTTDSNQSVDSWFLVANFTSAEAGDGAATDHIIAFGALQQTYDLGSVDQLELAAGAVCVTVD